MNLDPETLSHALGYGVSLTPATPNECWWGGTMEPVFEAGWCAKTGMEAALLAKAGATATPYVLEGKHGFLQCMVGRTEGAVFLTSDLGKTYAMEGTYIYPYPACGVNQVPIQAALLLSGHGLRARDIARVVEKVGQGGTLYAGNDFPGPATNQFQAQMSMQWCAAAAILGRPVDSFSFYAEHYDDPEVNALARKVELTWEWNRAKPRFEVYTIDGRILIGEEEVVNREPLIPTIEKMEKRFMAFSSEYLGEEKARKIVDTVLNLENIEDIRQLTVML